MPINFDINELRRVFFRLAEAQARTGWWSAQREAQPEAQREARRQQMSKQVTSLKEIALPSGEEIVVHQADDGKEVVWTSDGKGGFVNNNVTLEAFAFESAILNGNVYVPVTHTLGEIFTDATFYYKIVAKEGADWLVVKTDARGSFRHTSMQVLHTIPLNWYPHEDGGENANTTPAFNRMLELHQARRTTERLDAILASGEVPAEDVYRVSVDVRGIVEVEPSEAQARKLIGDSKVQVARVGATPVTYTKTVVVEKPSRWGCACDQVTGLRDLEGLAPGEVESWVVTECAPKGGVSTVHTGPVHEPKDEAAELKPGRKAKPSRAKSGSITASRPGWAWVEEGNDQAAEAVF